jgi:hypothetical protein
MGLLFQFRYEDALRRCELIYFDQTPSLYRHTMQPVQKGTEAPMSLQGERQKTHDLLKMPVICWRCDAPMQIKTIAPAMLSPSLDEIVYRCPACHMERTRNVMRAD